MAYKTTSWGTTSAMQNSKNQQAMPRRGVPGRKNLTYVRCSVYHNVISANVNNPARFNRNFGRIKHLLFSPFSRLNSARLPKDLLAHLLIRIPPTRFPRQAPWLVEISGSPTKQQQYPHPSRFRLIRFKLVE